jgi:hypothetical protein
MAVYKSTDQYYTVAEALFDRVQEENPDAADSVMEARLLIRFKCTDPTAELLINGRRRPASVSFGSNRVRPEVDAHMEMDVLHQILLGELGLAKALSNKKVKLRGPAWKALAVADLFHQCQDLYPQILKEQGLAT